MLGTASQAGCPQGPHGSPGAGDPGAFAALGPPRHSCVALGRQVDGMKHPSAEDGLQVVVIDGSRGHVLSEASFRNAILQGIPWQLSEHIAAIPDK